jgi:phosphoribosylglycinamide formyltransferase-1
MSAASGLALAIVISGRGSNMAAIAQACQSGQIAARIVRVIADRHDAGGIALAQRLGLEVSVVAHAEFANREAFESALSAAIEASGARLVVLAGFLRILSPQFAQRYAGTMLNIHPALLPKFPGLHTHQRALQVRESVHGASVHFVTGALDAGPIVLQARVPVRKDDTAESLSARVQRQEHIIYPKVIGWIAANRLRLVGDVVYFDDQPLTQPLIDAPGDYPP